MVIYNLQWFQRIKLIKYTTSTSQTNSSSSFRKKED